MPKSYHVRFSVYEISKHSLSHIAIKETKFPVTSASVDREGGILANVIKLQ